jgi:thymidylate synthase (FAD)
MVNIITAPSVHLLSEPKFHAHPEYVLPPHENDAENIIATGGKVCYDSFGADGRSVPEHIEALTDSGHGSVLEHAHFGVFIAGISRGCSHEIVRHRMFNYSQRSTRYTAEGGAAIVLEPFLASIYAAGEQALQVEQQSLRDFLGACQYALAEYDMQVERLMRLAPAGISKRDARKWVRGKARQLLPHALETRMVMTGNLRAWRHFFLMRTSRHAEPEIRRLAQAIAQLVMPKAPWVFTDFEPATIDDFLEFRTLNEMR